MINHQASTYPASPLWSDSVAVHLNHSVTSAIFCEMNELQALKNNEIEIVQVNLPSFALLASFASLCAPVPLPALEHY